MAICDNAAGEGVTVLYCDEDWEVLAVSGDESADAAKAHAERISLARWLAGSIPK